MEPEEYIDLVMDRLDAVEGDDDGYEDLVGELVEVGAIEEVGAKRLRRERGASRRSALKAMLRRAMGRKRMPGHGLPSPPFGRSSRDTERRAPLGFVEDGTGENFFSLAAGPGTTTTMRAKVSREAHTDRLLIVPSAPGVVIESLKVGDEEQLLSSGAPVELYSTAALTDTLPDNFSPLGPALDLIILLKNTTAVAITGTIGTKAAVKR